MHRSKLWQLPGLSGGSGICAGSGARRGPTRSAGCRLTLRWPACREASCAFRVSVLLTKYFKAHLWGCQLAGGPVPIILNSKYFVFPHQRREDGKRGEENEYLQESL